MNKHLRLTPVLLLAALLAGCQGPCEKLSPITAPASSTGSADFTRFVAAGTSISAGYQSGGVVNRHQVYAYPAIFARQIGKTLQLDGKGTFSQPAVDGNGILPLLQLRSISPLVISNSGLANGAAINTTFPTPYSDMAVPGAIVYDYANLTNYGGSAFLLVARGQGTIESQVLLQHPTFVSFEFGANEVLGPATSGSAVAPAGIPAANWNAVASPAAYSALLTGALAGIHAAEPNAKIALANVPDVRSIPFFTTFSPVTRDVRTGGLRHLIGWVHRDSIIKDIHGADSATVEIRKVDSLAVNELVTLKAQSSIVAGLGIPAFGYNYLVPAVAGTGLPLDSALVLDAREQAVIGGHVAAMNTAIDGHAASAWIAKVDLHGLLADLAAHGRVVGSTRYTTAFVTGGLFSLDGVHPSDLGHALIANEMIDAVNAKFGGAIAHVNTADYATSTASSAHPVATDGDILRGMRIEGLSTNLRKLYSR
jgi:hypothetical protein